VTWRGARQAYEEFFKYWDKADADAPLLVTAKREYAALKVIRHRVCGRFVTEATPPVDAAKRSTWDLKETNMPSRPVLVMSDADILGGGEPERFSLSSVAEKVRRSGLIAGKCRMICDV
jgi:hypothetical protein